MGGRDNETRARVLTLNVDETGAISSAVERILHTDEATGSRPVSPTKDIDKFVNINAESLGTGGSINIVKSWG